MPISIRTQSATKHNRAPPSPAKLPRLQGERAGDVRFPRKDLAHRDDPDGFEASAAGALLVRLDGRRRFIAAVEIDNSVTYKSRLYDAKKLPLFI